MVQCLLGDSFTMTKEGADLSTPHDDARPWVSLACQRPDRVLDE